jgi:hypothetical protein
VVPDLRSAFDEGGLTKEGDSESYPGWLPHVRLNSEGVAPSTRRLSCNLTSALLTPENDGRDPFGIGVPSIPSPPLDIVHKVHNTEFG